MIKTKMEQSPTKGDVLLLCEVVIADYSLENKQRLEALVNGCFIE